MYIKVKYDKGSGEVRSIDGEYVGIAMGLEKHETDNKEAVSVKDLVDLKEAGFTADEINEMHKKGVI